MELSLQSIQQGSGAARLAMLVAGCRAGGQPVFLFEGPRPHGRGVAGVGRLYDILSVPGGAAVRDATGHIIDEERDPNAVLAADALWRRLAASLREQGVRSPLAIGGFAFHPARDASGPWSSMRGLLLTVPRLTLTNAGGRVESWGEEALLDRWRPWRTEAPPLLEVSAARPSREWMSAVASASEQLRTGYAQKVVLAREVLARAGEALAVERTALSLRQAHSASFSFLVDAPDGGALVGASPELLVSRRGRWARCRPMAGSTARGRDVAEDLELGRRLATSESCFVEHDLTAQAVRETLAAHSEVVLAEPRRVERFATIQHLVTPVRARLAPSGPSVLALAAALHPTPAVGGYPRAAAIDLIDRLEGMERGWYSGAVGWVDADGDGEFAVTIRCGLLRGDTAHLYAGNGVVAGADPVVHLRETHPKLQVLLNALADSGGAPTAPSASAASLLGELDEQAR